MKINEKHLASFAVSNAPADKEGWLLKRGEVNKAFQKRWFVLKGNLLFYFERRGDKDPIGVIILEGCTVELAESADLYTFELAFHGASSRTYILATDTQEEMEEWMKAVTCANYEYMRLMVSELQRQFDELNMESKSPPWNRTSVVKANESSNLVDLSQPSSQNAGKSTARFNPFDSKSENVDQFGAMPFQFDTYAAGVSRTRTFEEMHEEFGLYIKEKMKSHRKPPAHPLVNIDDSDTHVNNLLDLG